jgi:nucleotide-binding universal stress UspA family protein
MYDHILLVADGLDGSAQAARMVGETARRMQSADLCIAVAYPPVPDCLGAPYFERAVAKRQARAEAVARRLRQEVGAVPGKIQTEVLEGTVAEVAQSISQVRGSDLIVIGSRETGPVRRMWAGFHGADHALCPVMVV